MAALAGALPWMFAAVCAGALLLLLGCHLASEQLWEWNSVPWAFQLSRAPDVRLHCVLYVAFHSTPLGRHTHGFFLLDVLAWFIVLLSVHPGLLVAVLAGLLLLAWRMSSRSTGLVLVLVWAGCAALAVWLGQGTVRGAQALLLGNALLRVLGHLYEPVPPMIGGAVDRFRPLSQVRLGMRVLPLALVGYLSEFAAGLPWGLIRVQAAWLAARVNKDEVGWQEAMRLGRRVHAAGLRAYPPITAMIKRYLERRAK